MSESSGSCVGSKANVEVGPPHNPVAQPQSHVLLGGNIPRFQKAEPGERLAFKPWLCHALP